MTITSPRTVHEAFLSTTAISPDAVAIIDAGVSGATSVTFAELAAGAERVMGFLDEVGVRRGDTVATLLPNCRAWVETHIAAAAMGVLLIPLNTRYRADEITHLLRISQAKLLLTAAEFEGIDFATRIAAVAAMPELLALEHVVSACGDVDQLPDCWTAHDWTTVISSARRPDLALARPSDPVIAFGTSGTTSSPKLAVHTNESILAHLPDVAERVGLGPDLPQITVLSLSGTFGWVPFTAGLLAGGRTVLLPIFKRARVLSTLAEHPASLIVAAEGSLRELFEVGDVEGAPLRVLERAVTAGLYIGDIVEAAAAWGVTAQNVYGSSEVHAFAATAPQVATDSDRTLPGCSLVASGARARVVDDQGVEVPRGETGELQIGGDSVFVHYLANDEASAAARTADGWFRTGDSGRMLGDRVFEYLGRANDTLRLGGYSTSPTDVETTIERLSGVAQAQVVGVRDRRTGDDLGVAFVRVSDPTVDEQVIGAWCKEHLASYKIPTAVVLVEKFPSIPSSNGDKVRRDVLRERAADLLTTNEVAGR